MSTAWVAGAVRAKALASRRLGPAGARELAAEPDLASALAVLAAGPYGRDVHPGQNLAEAQHAVGAALLWNLRVLAGWLPRGGADLVRLLAAGFEVANVDELLAALRGAAGDPPYRLGGLATAWPRLPGATSLAEVDAVLATSPWKVRGSTSDRDVHVGLRLAWADGVAAALPEAAGWARAAAALLVLREVVLERRPLPAPTLAKVERLLGPGLLARASAADDLADLAPALPGGTRWVLDGVHRPEDLWRAEATWWRRVEADGFTLLRTAGYDRRPVVGAAAVLGADAWRVRAALETAARGGTGPGLEAFDGVA